MSANDAEKCININPSFIKGYFRLAKAQKESGKFDDALATVKKGLAIDSIDKEHKKQMRKFKAEVKEAKAEEYRNQVQHAYDKVIEGLIVGQEHRVKNPQTERHFDKDKCLHGVNPISLLSPENRICHEFRETFFHGFKNVTFRTKKYHFIQDTSSAIINKGSQPNCTRVVELYDSDEHTLVSYIKKIIPCNCLDEKYKEVRYISKTTRCYNENCSLPRGVVEQSKATCCSKCRQATYCSRSCQVQDWPRHKIVCGVNNIIDSEAERKAAHDALEALLVIDAAGSADKNTNNGGGNDRKDADVE